MTSGLQLESIKVHGLLRNTVDTGKIAKVSFTDYAWNMKVGMYQADEYMYKFRS
jgi:hypothetical protein